MAFLAAMRGACKREFLRAKAIAIGSAGFYKHECLQGLDGGSWKDGRFDVAKRENAPALAIYHRNRTAMTAFHQAAAHDFDEGWITHI